MGGIKGGEITHTVNKGFFRWRIAFWFSWRVLLGDDGWLFCSLGYPALEGVLRVGLGLGLGGGRTYVDGHGC